MPGRTAVAGNIIHALRAHGANNRLGSVVHRTLSAVPASKDHAESSGSTVSWLGLVGGLVIAALPVAASAQAKDARLGAPAGKASEAASKAPQQAAAHKGAAQPGQKDPQGRPVYTAEEVAKHKTPSDRIWVTYKDGVYDITEFVEAHPGGAAKILMAAGGSVDPFWALYQQHQKPEVVGILEPFRIGTLAGGAASAPAAAVEDPYKQDPPRHPALVPRSARPFNGETPPSLLAANLITPTDIFYVRNHLPVPDIAPAAYRLQVVGDGVRSLSWSVDELRAKFRSHTITATVQCSGNRRTEMGGVKPVKGLAWDQGAIGTATWTGVLLREVLKEAGIREDDPSIKHIIFEGLDKDPSTGEVYGVSIPVDRALSRTGDVLLAYEMNGAPLNRDHGAPLRVVVPGVTGARSVKWVGRIIASDKESGSHWQQRDYKSFNPHIDWDTVDWDSAPAIQDAPVTSAICEPEPGATVSADDGKVTVRGYAWSGGGRGVVRVDVSADGGRTWTSAKLRHAPGQAGSYSRAWAWALWEAAVPVPAGATSLQLICKAVDSSYNNQPDSVAPIWNLRGVVNNAWHRVQVQLEQD